jgi:hypothetical protein
MSFLTGEREFGLEQRGFRPNLDDFRVVWEPVEARHLSAVREILASGEAAAVVALSGAVDFLV